MKKKIIIGFSLAIIVICILSSIVINVYNNKIINNKVEELKQDLKSFGDYINKYNYSKNGTLNITAKYKGAHGENYPADFKYAFDINDNIKLSSEEGTYEFTYTNEFIDIVNKLRNINNNIDELINIKKVSNKTNKVIYILDNESINKILNTNFKETFVILNTSGLIKKVDNVIITLDDITISYSEDSINIHQNNNNVKVKINSGGYSLNLNNKLKMNVFIEEDMEKYSVVANNYVFYAELKENEILFKASSEAAIYNSMDIIVNFDKLEFNNESELERISIPILRYADNIEIKVIEE